jgi:hypothetical protein
MHKRGRQRSYRLVLEGTQEKATQAKLQRALEHLHQQKHEPLYKSLRYSNISHTNIFSKIHQKESYNKNLKSLARTIVS